MIIDGEKHLLYMGDDTFDLTEDVIHNADRKKNQDGTSYK